MNSIVIIPALNPPEYLISYADELIDSGANELLIVDDGSSPEKQFIFKELSLRPQCHVLVHKNNLGKGRALKDAFSYILSEEKYYGKSVITADSDGQHLVRDILRLDAQMQLTNPADTSRLYLGCRNFDKEDIPWRSRFGNRLTSVLFQLLYKESVMDTKTGLRGIPYALLELLTQLKGERFEFEMNMLTEIALKKIPFEIVEIETIYLDNNSESHFRPVADSFRIYGILLGNFFKYFISSMLSALLDLLLFTIIDYILPVSSYQILTATVIARIFSSLFNYWFNKNLVFQNTESAKTSIYKYYGLCITVMFVSAGMVTLLSPLPISNTLIKMFVDTILYLLNYFIQKHYIFAENRSTLWRNTL